MNALTALNTVADGIHSPEEGLIRLAHHELLAFLDAIAALAELIEAARVVDAMKGSTSDERIRLRLALARCEGGKP